MRLHDHGALHHGSSRIIRSVLDHRRCCTLSIRCSLTSICLVFASMTLVTAARAQQVLLIQDADPWSSSAWTDALDSAGLTTTIAGSPGLPSVDFTDYDIVITVSVQGSQYNSRISARQADLEAFVTQGGVLVFSACSYDVDLPYADPPFGGTTGYSEAEYNDLPDPSHPLVDGVVGPLYGEYASHMIFTNTPVGVVEIATHDTLGDPTLYVLYDGSGLLIVSGLTLEWGVEHGLNYGPILANALDVAVDHLTCGDADWDGHADAACGGDDCDDADAAVYPGAAEDYDQVDDDCDGLVDEGTLPANAVVITEIMAEPDTVADSLGEWFEIANTTAYDIELAGLEVSDTGYNAFTVDSSLVIPALGYLVFGASEDGGINGGLTVDHEVSNFSLGDALDEIILVHGGLELDRVEYSSPDWPSQTGAAMNLDSAMLDTAFNDDFANWCAAFDTYGSGDLGTPGTANPSCCPDYDGDGYLDASCGGDDCDDSDAGVNPGATETACTGGDDDCDGALHDEELDDDLDGVTECDGDCDDADATNFPGNSEACDGLDNDCDELVDEDADEDLDGDGYNACQGDCDNEDPDTYPGAEEVCDGADNDCDGVLLDDEMDEDGDGYNTCQGDCDEGNPDVNPGAEEACDGVDTNCDGLIGEDEVDGDHDDWMVCAGDCDDTDKEIQPGIFEDCGDGIDNDCDGAADSEDAECEGVIGDDDDDDTGGCDCDAAGAGAPHAGALVLALLALLVRRRG